VTVTSSSTELSAPDFAVKVAEVAPEATVTEAGTVSTLALLARAMASAAAAAVDKVTVHVVLVLFGITGMLLTAGSAQVKAESRPAGFTVRVAVCCRPFNFATIVASVTLAADVVVAVNVPVALPAAIVNVAGTVTCAELLVRLIDAPPEPAFADRFTVHVLEAPPITVAGAQLTEEIVTADGVTVRDVVGEDPL
jgi:hypothetical protein